MPVDHSHPFQSTSTIVNIFLLGQTVLHPVIPSPY